MASPLDSEFNCCIREKGAGGRGGTSWLSWRGWWSWQGGHKEGDIIWSSGMSPVFLMSMNRDPWKETVSDMDFPISGLCRVSFLPCQQSVLATHSKFSWFVFIPIYGSNSLSWCFASHFPIWISYLSFGDPSFLGFQALWLLPCNLISLTASE